jgi:hypothetical protein
MMILSVALVSGFVVSGYAQTPTQASPESVSLSLTADSVDTRPLHGYDGVARPGPAEQVTTLSGNVEILINGMRVTADHAVWYWQTNTIELGRGDVTRIQFPGRIRAFRVAPRRP